MLQENFFCSLGFLDLNTCQGNDLLLVYLSPRFDMQKIIKASSFYIDSLSQKLTIIQGYQFNPDNGQPRELHNECITVPSLFVRLQMIHDEPSLMNLAKKLIFYYNDLSQETRNELLYVIMYRLWFYFQIFIYPIITFFLFLMAEHYRYYKWVFLLLPYPGLTFLGICITFLLNYGIPLWLLASLCFLAMLFAGISGTFFWKKSL